MVVRVKIDRQKCVVAHFCLFYAPVVFMPSLPEGKPAIAEQYRLNNKVDEGVVPDSLYEVVKEAEKNCPSGAIKVYRE
ncbi:ferredoxin [Thermoproteus tenax]|uniref:Ferredoxin n=1 Tax=Thermoproteus tenax (strain ATCC 35583 / DSM 2078 / JCM 9277 / NBRC 100435 / Kra 1) TaxID=768679 RepID=G4RP45_THETK|nr:ferredoxin [Thermoproteus tenax]CCC81340.1 Ferredoxin [Thermoproteus tenax Kra 1]